MFSKLKWKEWQNITEIFSKGSKNVKTKTFVALFAVNIENSKNLKYKFSKKRYLFLSVTLKMKLYLKNKN